MVFKFSAFDNFNNTTACQVSHKPLVTALICNYNYGRFLKKAIDSTLNQTWERMEVLVVDDGSTDESRSVLEGYKDRIRVILKENGGQASAFNAGIAEAHGEIICFLDSDDFWYSNKVERIVAKYKEASWGLVCNTLHEVDENGELIDNLPREKLIYFPPLHNGDLIEYLIEHNYNWVFSPTSGMSLPKWIANNLLPLPEEEWRICADNPIAYSAICHAPVGVIEEPLGAYRYHEVNGFASIRNDQIATSLFNFLGRAKRFLFLNSYLSHFDHKVLYKEPKDFYKYYRSCCFVTRINPYKSLINLWRHNLHHHFKTSFLGKPVFNAARYFILDTLLALLILFKLPTPYDNLRQRYRQQAKELSQPMRRYLEND